MEGRRGGECFGPIGGGGVTGSALARSRAASTPNVVSSPTHLVFGPPGPTHLPTPSLVWFSLGWYLTPPPPRTHTHTPTWSPGKNLVSMYHMPGKAPACVRACVVDGCKSVRSHSPKPHNGD